MAGSEGAGRVAAETKVWVYSVGHLARCLATELLGKVICLQSQNNGQLGGVCRWFVILVSISIGQDASSMVGTRKAVLESSLVTAHVCAHVCENVSMYECVKVYV